MKIVSPISNNKGMQSLISEHFGRSPHFLLIHLEDDDVKKYETIENPFAQKHRPLEVPKYLKSISADVVISQGMGQRALKFFSENGVKVITGISGTVKDALSKFLSEESFPQSPCKESTAHCN